MLCKVRVAKGDGRKHVLPVVQLGDLFLLLALVQGQQQLSHDLVVVLEAVIFQAHEKAGERLA